MSTFLVVDDDKDIRHLVSTLLQAVFPQVQVVEAQNGQQALDQALDSKPDLILLDGRLPVMNGDEVARTLRGLPQFKDVPLVGLSAEADGNPISNGLKECCNRFLPKPFAITDLMQTVAGVCG